MQDMADNLVFGCLITWVWVGDGDGGREEEEEEEEVFILQIWD